MLLKTVVPGWGCPSFWPMAQCPSPRICLRTLRIKRKTKRSFRKAKDKKDSPSRGYKGMLFRSPWVLRNLQTTPLWNPWLSDLKQNQPPRFESQALSCHCMAQRSARPTGAAVCHKHGRGFLGCVRFFCFCLSGFNGKYVFKPKENLQGLCGFFKDQLTLGITTHHTHFSLFKVVLLVFFAWQWIDRSTPRLCPAIGRIEKKLSIDHYSLRTQYTCRHDMFLVNVHAPSISFCMSRWWKWPNKHHVSPLSLAFSTPPGPVPAVNEHSSLFSESASCNQHQHLIQRYVKLPMMRGI